MNKCARCDGSMILGSDQYGSYIHCLRCGALVEVIAPRPAPNPVQVAKLQADLIWAEKEALLARRREYKQRPEVKANDKACRLAYEQRPEVKAMRRAYERRPEVKARRRVRVQENYQARKQDQIPT